MNQTSRMVGLLQKLRRERNGVWADTLVDNCSAGMNYGVSLPTIRAIAREEGKDEEFARMLWQQDVRELKLVALYLIDPESLTMEVCDMIAKGLNDAELAEECAFALLRHSPLLKEIFPLWSSSSKAFLRYAALQAAPRSELLNIGWLDDSKKALLMEGTTEKESLLIARALVAMWAALAMKSPDNVAVIRSQLDALPQNSVGGYVREELSWQLDYAQ